MKKEQKQKAYDKNKKIADSTTDSLGKHIDDGIKDLCIILNTIGFRTNGSCEGHLKWGELCPWVDITYREAQDDYIEWSKEYDRVEKIEKSGKGNPKTMYKELHRLRAVKEKKLSKICIKIEDLLKEFYKKRGEIKDLDSIISFDKKATWIRLIPYGSGLQMARNLREREFALEKYHKEFSDFKKFLEDKYFGANR